jgi:hypothetical protein
MQGERLALEDPASEPCGRETKGVCDWVILDSTHVRRLMQAISDPSPTGTIFLQGLGV